MGRFSASGARLHEPRQPKPRNAAFRQNRPPQSHGFSLGLEHPQSAIRAACREKPALGRCYRAASHAPRRSGGWTAEAAKGSAPRLLPLEPHRPHARSKRRGGCCPGRAAARRTRNIPTEFRATSARLRQFGGDAGPRGPSRIRRSAPPPGHIGGQAEQGGLASAADRETQAKAHSVARLRRSFCQNGGLASANRGEHAAR